MELSSVRAGQRSVTMKKEVEPFYGDLENILQFPEEKVLVVHRGRCNNMCIIVCTSM